MIIDTLKTRPRDATHWSARTLAKELALSHATVGRIWRAFGLQPHRSETFKLSRDPLFVEKVRDIVGLYLAPPDRALVPSVDEKSQIKESTRAQLARRAGSQPIKATWRANGPSGGYIWKITRVIAPAAGTGALSSQSRRVGGFANGPLPSSLRAARRERQRTGLGVAKA